MLTRDSLTYPLCLPVCSPDSSRDFFKGQIGQMNRFFALFELCVLPRNSVAQAKTSVNKAFRAFLRVSLRCFAAPCGFSRFEALLDTFSRCGGALSYPGASFATVQGCHTCCCFDAEFFMVQTRPSARVLALRWVAQRCLAFPCVFSRFEPFLDMSSRCGGSKCFQVVASVVRRRGEGRQQGGPSGTLGGHSAKKYRKPNGFHSRRKKMNFFCGQGDVRAWTWLPSFVFFFQLC